MGKTRVQNLRIIKLTALVAVSFLGLSCAQYKEHYRQGRQLHEVGEYESSAAELQKAIDSKEDFSEAYHALGETYYQLGQGDMAIASLNKAIEFDPDYKEAYETKGIVCLTTGDYSEAAEALETAIRLETASSDKFTYLYLADAYNRLNEPGKAVSAIKEYIESNPSDKSAKRLLKNAIRSEKKRIKNYIARGHTRRAIEDYKTDPPLPVLPGLSNVTQHDEVKVSIESWLYDFVDTVIFRLEILKFRFAMGSDVSVELEETKDFLDKAIQVNFNTNELEACINKLIGDYDEGIEVKTETIRRDGQQQAIRHTSARMIKLLKRRKKELESYLGIFEVVTKLLKETRQYCDEWSILFGATENLSGRESATTELIEVITPAIEDWERLLQSIRFPG